MASGVLLQERLKDEVGVLLTEKLGQVRRMASTNAEKERIRRMTEAKRKRGRERGSPASNHALDSDIASSGVAEIRRLRSRVCRGVQAKEVLSALVEAEHHVGTLNPYYMDTVNKARSQVEQAAKAPPPLISSRSSSYHMASTSSAGAPGQTPPFPADFVAKWAQAQKAGMASNEQQVRPLAVSSGHLIL